MAQADQPNGSEQSQIEEIIGLCRRRAFRAEEKLRAAQAELRAAYSSLSAAEQRLARWIEANPDPQRSIFEELSNV
ncbi:MAG: hypothetical protein CL949_25140 [Erythrobacter sp.]|nr:hypothetical protein [Erythrobacter sp.]|tara:strand:+ start:215 stop:442 length:228 start_codon:yes stop_codon:yes gene_type:complete